MSEEEMNTLRGEKPGDTTDLSDVLPVNLTSSLWQKEMKAMMNDSKMEEKDRERINKELKDMTKGNQHQLDPYSEKGYTESYGAQPSKDKLADRMIKAMSDNQIDVYGQPIEENKNEISNNKQLGYIKVGILSIMSLAVSLGIVVLGVMIGR